MASLRAGGLGLSAVLLTSLVSLRCGSDDASGGGAAAGGQCAGSTCDGAAGTAGGSGATADACGSASCNAPPYASWLDVYGTALIGRTLRVDYEYADAEGDGPGKSSYRWLRDGEPIEGATQSEYTTTAADQGHYVEAEVTVTAVSGTASGFPERSAWIGPIRDALTAADEQLSLEVEFEAPAPHVELFANTTTSALYTWRGVTYFVYIDQARRPVVGTLKDGTVSTEFLDPDPSLTILEDGHLVFSIGVGRDGFVHVVGNMHNAEITQHWISKQPWSISSFEFVGDKPALTFPGHGYTYLSFKTDMNGKLYARGRGHTTDAANWTEGLIAWVLYEYDPTTRTWHALGGKHPDQVPTAKFESVFWEDSGQYYPAGDNSVYQGFFSDLEFDANNRMHVCTAIADDPTLTAATHILYAYSDDDGKTFRRADGSAVELPMRAEAGSQQPDVLASPADLNASGNFDGYWSDTALGLDEHGTPLVAYSVLNNVGGWKSKPTDPIGWDPQQYRALDPLTRTWGAAQPDPGGSLNGEEAIDGPMGIFTWFGGHPNGFVVRTHHPSEPGYDHTFGGVLRAPDSRSVREQGVVRVWRRTPDNTQQIVTLRAEPKLSPLPADWTLAAVGGASGAVGVLDGRIQLESTGATSFGDSPVLIHRAFTGDFDLQARVLSVEVTTPSAFAGLFVADGEALESFFACAVSASEGLWARHRSSGGAVAESVVEHREASEWLRISRRGNRFEAFYGDDGRNWQSITSAELPLAAEVRLGLAGAAGSKTGAARVDHLRVAPR